MKKQNMTYLAQAAMIAAAYAALTYLAAVMNLAYGPIQFRFSEALTILPVFTPAAIPGLTVGCLLGNLTSTVSPMDIIFGTAATLIAALGTRMTRNITWKGMPLLAPLFPVACNALIIGAEICVFYTKDTSFLGFITAATQVCIGQLAMCYGLGLPLFVALRRTNLFPTKLNQARQSRDE